MLTSVSASSVSEMKWTVGAGEVYKPLVLSAAVALDQRRHLVGTDDRVPDTTAPRGSGKQLWL